MNYQAKLAHALQRMWNGTGLVSTLLLPLSWITGIVVRRKIDRYTHHPDRVWQGSVPVVIVGNIYVGGTGKTPVVMALVDALIQRGWRPGVISRGYGVRIGNQPRTGRGTLDPGQFGDEPALIAASTSVPIAVHPSRPLAAQALIRDFPDVNVIVADDGLQHLALGRDAEIIVQDGRGTGNGRLLPAGPLREPATRLAHVDVIVTNIPEETEIATRTGHHPVEAQGQPASGTQPSVTPGHTKPTASPIAPPGPTHPAPAHVTMTLVPCDVTHLKSGTSLPWETWLAAHRHTPASAVAAIGHPERFFAMLRHDGLTLTHTLALQDHTTFAASTFASIDTNIILITTKDAIKCRTINDDRLWAVRVHPHFSDLEWLDTLNEKLTSAARLKSPGHPVHTTLN